MRIIILAFISIPFCSFAQNAKDLARFIYSGQHDTNDYFYVFLKDGRFEGDILDSLNRDIKTKGTYIIFNDTIFITPLPKKLQVSKYYYQYPQKFLIDGDSYIIDLEILFDYCILKYGGNQMYKSRKRILSPIKNSN